MSLSKNKVRLAQQLLVAIGVYSESNSSALITFLAAYLSTSVTSMLLRLVTVLLIFLFNSRMSSTMV